MQSINLAGGASGSRSSKQGAETVVQVYENLLDHGFLHEHIQQALHVGAPFSGLHPKGPCGFASAKGSTK